MPAGWPPAGEGPTRAAGDATQDRLRAAGPPESAGRSHLQGAGPRQAAGRPHRPRPAFQRRMAHAGHPRGEHAGVSGPLGSAVWILGATAGSPSRAGRLRRARPAHPACEVLAIVGRSRPPLMHACFRKYVSPHNRRKSFTAQYLRHISRPFDYASYAVYAPIAPPVACTIQVHQLVKDQTAGLASPPAVRVTHDPVFRPTRSQLTTSAWLPRLGLAR